MEFPMNERSSGGLVPDHIVNQVAQLRPDWDRPGIQAAVKRALLKFPIVHVQRAAIDTAKDATARTPGVIAYRCEVAAKSGKYAEAEPAPLSVELGPRHCGQRSCPCPHIECRQGWVADDTAPCPTCRPHLTEALAELARARADAAARAPRPSSPEFVRQLLAETAAAREHRTGAGI